MDPVFRLAQGLQNSLVAAPLGRRGPNEHDNRTCAEFLRLRYDASRAARKDGPAGPEACIEGSRESLLFSNDSFFAAEHQGPAPPRHPRGAPRGRRRGPRTRRSSASTWSN